MQAYKLETKLSENGMLTLKGLPFHSGEKVEIIIIKSKSKKKSLPSLKGKVIKYDKPFEPVALEDWEILK